MMIDVEKSIPGAEYLRQSPPAPLNVGTPDSAETPAPVRMTTRSAAARCSRKAAKSEEGREREEDMAVMLLEAAASGETRRRKMSIAWDQGCHMAKFYPFLFMDCAKVEGVGAQSKERKGSNFAA